MATKTRNIRRTTKLKAAATPKRRRTPVARKGKSSGRVFNTIVPLVFMVAIIFCLGFLLVMGFRTVAASSFFDVQRIEVNGISKVSKVDVEKIVKDHSNRGGVWNSELELIKSDVEKLSFVKEAVVSRVLPDGIQVHITERIPRAVVRINSSDFWVDDEGTIVAVLGKNEPRPPIILRGWDDTKSEKALKNNQDRVKQFAKLRDEFQSAGLNEKVASVDLSDMQDVVVHVPDSDESIAVKLGREDIVKRLQTALNVVAGKGQTIESLISHGGNVVATYRNR